MHRPGPVVAAKFYFYIAIDSCSTVIDAVVKRKLQ